MHMYVYIYICVDGLAPFFLASEFRVLRRSVNASWDGRGVIYMYNIYIYIYIYVYYIYIYICILYIYILVYMCEKDAYILDIISFN